MIAAGTLLTAGILLTYLRGRVERLIARLTDAASTDPLTGLPNRVGATRRVLRPGARARRGPSPPGSVLVLIDIDRFKELNRRHGVEVGDSALQRARLAARRSRRG